MDEMASRYKAIFDKKSVVATPHVESRFKFPKTNGRASSHDPLAPTIFHEDWWLGAATNGNFEVAEVADGGRIVGRLPFNATKRFGLRMIRMPVLTHFLGPAIDEGEGSRNTRFLKRLEITRNLLAKLPQASWQYVKCHRGITDVIAFQELGFRTYVQFTHEIAPNTVEILWQQLRNKTRNVIRKAEEQFKVAELTDPEEFIQLYKHNLEVKNVENEIDGGLCRKIISASIERQRGRIFTARDKEGRIVAANFCVWDETSSFYLLSTRCNNSGNSAISLLLWEAIKDSAQRGLVFDFAGLGNKGSVLFYSGFGAAIGVRYVALRARVLARLLNELRFFSGQENCFY
jgi:hypothetical protein